MHPRHALFCFLVLGVAFVAAVEITVADATGLRNALYDGYISKIYVSNNISILSSQWGWARPEVAKEVVIEASPDSVEPVAIDFNRGIGLVTVKAGGHVNLRNLALFGTDALKGSHGRLVNFPFFYSEMGSNLTVKNCTIPISEKLCDLAAVGILWDMVRELGQANPEGFEGSAFDGDGTVYINSMLMPKDISQMVVDESLWVEPPYLMIASSYKCGLDIIEYFPEKANPVPPLGTRDISSAAELLSFLEEAHDVVNGAPENTEALIVGGIALNDHNWPHVLVTASNMRIRGDDLQQRISIKRDSGSQVLLGIDVGETLEVHNLLIEMEEFWPGSLMFRRDLVSEDITAETPTECALHVPYFVSPGINTTLAITNTDIVYSTCFTGNSLDDCLSSMGPSITTQQGTRRLASTIESANASCSDCAGGALSSETSDEMRVLENTVYFDGVQMSIPLIGSDARFSMNLILDDVSVTCGTFKSPESTNATLNKSRGGPSGSKAAGSVVRLSSLLATFFVCAMSVALLY